MNIKDYEIKFRRLDKNIKLYCLGDIHAGTIHCVEDRIQNKVQEIKNDKHAYWIGMGDYGEFILPNDKRFDPSHRAIASWIEQDNIAECQRRWLVRLFKPIRSKCIGLLYGNHEEDIRTRHYNNIQQNMCDDLGVDNLGYSSFIRLFFRRENSTESHIVKCAFTHGYSWATTKGAKLNKLRRFMDDFDALIYGYAHMHDVIVDAKPYMTVTSQSFGQAKIKEIESVGAVTGSWFRTYTKGIIASYGEKKAYPPSTLGCAVFEINPNTGEVEAHRSK